MQKGQVVEEGFWKGFKVIDVYSRADALEDGTLVDVSAVAREAGIKFPVAVTRTVWEAYIEPSEHDRQRWAQDTQGRLWDTVWMLRDAIRRSRDSSIISYTLRYRLNGRLRVVALKAVCGPGDDGEPVITVMMPEED
jgi:Family of unknown function (DUF6573)